MKIRYVSTLVFILIAVPLLAPALQKVKRAEPNAPKQILIPKTSQNLLELYKQRPSDQVIAEIQRDFKINWPNDRSLNLTWPAQFDFNQTGKQPSKTVIISRLNILRNQKFSEPLPFTKLSIYDYVRKNTQGINVRLNCNSNSDGAGSMNLNVSSGVWNSVESGTCKLSNSFNKDYIDALSLFVHEARHSEPGDPGHTSCGISGGNDNYFENGSGYSYAAMYLMWVYKYSINDPQEVKERAKRDAAGLLKDRFCHPPRHSNPKVQAIISELLSRPSVAK